MRIKHHTSYTWPGLADKVCKMLDAVLYFFVTLVFTVIILFVFTVISAKNAVRRRNNNNIIIDSNQHPEIESETELKFDEVENTPEFVRHSDSLEELWEAYDTMPEEYTGSGHHQQVLDLRRRCSSASSSSESSRRSSNAAVQSLFQMFVSDKKLDKEAHQEAVELLTRGEEDGEEARRTSWPLLQLRKRKSRHFSLRNIPE